MTIGKSNRQFRKKGRKQKADPFLKKVWYDVKAPNIFRETQIGKTCVNPTGGGKTSEQQLDKRMFEVSLGDLNKDERKSYMQFKFRVEHVSGTNCFTNFYGMRLTNDKVQSLVVKYHTLIEAVVNVKTTDGYTVRVFCIGFTKKDRNQVKKTCYAQSSQVREIRRRMVNIMIKESNCTLKELTLKLISESVPKEITKQCQSVFPLQNVYLRKMKVLKTPKVDVDTILKLHGFETKKKKETGKKVNRKKKKRGGNKKKKN
ncbi:40S ribosomal protein S3A [Anaeramoeba flamelloides]|uniref:Small ribosomal subunit protein eS1 n=1 Tax=Anaeramoeba flamelloides TaxID=1746091 RepID=A0AAV7Z9L0_9EUKA|nr:40S ribosomal protein S3A [Anaeramoeba flamelloides]